MHPLSRSRSASWSRLPPHRHDARRLLSEWAAAKVGLPFVRIDPLKIDFTKVADVMSASYAARFNILPLELTPTTLVVATAEPFASNGKPRSPRSRAARSSW
jgi:general secretion pathway protein E